MAPVCMCVRGELTLDGDLSSPLAVGFEESIMDFTVSERTCT